MTERQPVRHHQDAEASNALAGFVIEHAQHWITPGGPRGWVPFSLRYGIAGDFLHWLDENRPGWSELRRPEEQQ